MRRADGDQVRGDVIGDHLEAFGDRAPDDEAVRLPSLNPAEAVVEETLEPSLGPLVAGRVAGQEVDLVDHDDDQPTAEAVHQAGGERERVMTLGAPVVADDRGLHARSGSASRESSAPWRGRTIAGHAAVSMTARATLPSRTRRTGP